jgi:hypothetical protein
MAKPDLMGLVVRDMAKSLRFYRRLGMEIPASADQEGHVEVVLPGGCRIAWDTKEKLKRNADTWFFHTELKEKRPFLFNKKRRLSGEAPQASLVPISAAD